MGTYAVGAALLSVGYLLNHRTLQTCKKMEEKQFTICIFTENKIGLLNRISIIFTRRKINIESLTTSESEIKNVYPFTIVVNMTEENIVKVVKQMEKQIEEKQAVIKSSRIVKLCSTGLITSVGLP